MPGLTTAAGILWTLYGHAALWAGMVNRLHGLGWPRRISHRLTALMFLVFLAIPAWWIVWAITSATRWEPLAAWAFPTRLAAAYVGLCWLMAATATAGWIGRRVGALRVGVLREECSESIGFGSSQSVLTPPSASIGAPAAPTAAVANANVVDCPHRPTPSLLGQVSSGLLRRAWASLPPLCFVQRTIALPRLGPELDGLRLIHLSDLHFTGYVAKSYFEEAVCRTNQRRADLVTITGDLIDTPSCFDWLSEILGRIESRYGVYFILGNHDQDFGAEEIRAVLSRRGLIDLGGKWRQAEVRDVPIVLAGNELPWLRPAADWCGAPPGRSAGGPLRIVLAHSPDQFGWACRHDADLVLSGHVHGGQVRLPLVGPILTPSLFGVHYADRAIYRRGPTVMHVSRGVSGQVPLRYGCPPEIVELLLRGSG